MFHLRFLGKTKTLGFFPSRKTLVYVESPLQLINAVEAVNYFNISNPKYLIRYNNSRTNDAQLRLVVNIFSLKNVQSLLISKDICSISDILNSIFLNIIFISNIIVRRKVIIGNYNSGILHFIKFFLVDKKTLLIDDGLKSFETSKKLDKREFDWFTIFNLPVKGEQIFRNNFTVTSNILVGGKLTESKEIFLGSPFYENDLMTREEYLDHLIFAKGNLFKSSDLVYIPHRMEDREKLWEINDLGFSVFESAVPVELLGIKYSFRIKKVVSFYSTALVTCSKIYGSISVAIKFNYSNWSNAQEINRLYRQFNNMKSIEVVDINENGYYK